MQERVHKLLILVGEEGPQNEKCDYKKLSEVILNYLAENNQNFNQFFVKIMDRVIKEIPLKQHMYAALTAEISLKFSQISTTVIENSLKNLETTLSEGSLYESINIFEYLSELLNISMLNSSTFMNILEDLLRAIESESQQSQHRGIFINVLVQTIPICAHSLNEKMFHELKKVIDRIRKLGVKDDLLLKVLKDHSKGEFLAHSLVPRLQVKIDIPSQYHANCKLQIDSKLHKAKSSLNSYYSFCADKDDLYQIYSSFQGACHRNSMERLIEVFHTESQHLVLKLINYLKFHERDQVYLIKFVVQTLLNKALKSKCSLLESSLLASICKEEAIGKETQKNLQEQLLMLFNDWGEKFSFDVLMEFTKILSYIFNAGALAAVWDWELYLENSEKFKQRSILLKITVERILLLNDKLQIKEMETYIPASRKKIEEYTVIEEMEIFEAFTEKLGQKAEAEVIIPMVISEQTYRIFLESLLQKTSLSQTHLQILFKRYERVFDHFKKDYDWILIDKIRHFWVDSFSNRLLYLKEIIGRHHADYKSYVKYVGQLETSGQGEIEVKLELNELNKVYAKELANAEMTD